MSELESKGEAELDNLDDRERLRITRREAIRKAAIAAGIVGAGVWVAPVIIDSIASPAAAVTAPYFRFSYTCSAGVCTLDLVAGACPATPNAQTANFSSACATTTAGTRAQGNTFGLATTVNISANTYTFSTTSPHQITAIADLQTGNGGSVQLVTATSASATQPSNKPITNVYLVVSTA